MSCVYIRWNLANEDATFKPGKSVLNYERDVLILGVNTMYNYIENIKVLGLDEVATEVVYFWFNTKKLGKKIYLDLP